MLRLLNSIENDPTNIGNPTEMTILEFAERWSTRSPATRAGSSSSRLPEDDPKQRKPDISKARALLDWQPSVALREGLVATIADYRRRLKLD